jgi:hypothetical protein
VSLLQLLAAVFQPFESRAEAEQRAQRLLETHLSASQLAQFGKFGWFEVTGGETGTRYVIRNSTCVNVDQLSSSGECIKRWCFSPRGNLAKADVLLAQKLALECFEREALNRARSYTTIHDLGDHGISAGRRA